MSAVAHLKVRRIVARQDHLMVYPEHAPYIAHECASLVVEGDEASSVHFDRALSAEMLTDLRYGSGKKERAIKHVEEGKLTSTARIQGVYRLTDASGSELLHFIRTFN